MPSRPSGLELWSPSKRSFTFCLLSLLELMFLETSALTGENVEEAFVQCARKILNKIESGKRLSIDKLFFSIFSFLAQQYHFLIFQE